MFPPEIAAAIVHHCSTFQSVADAVNTLSALACTCHMFSAEVKRVECTLSPWVRDITQRLSDYATFDFPDTSTLGTLRLLSAFLESPERLQCRWYRTVCFNEGTHVYNSTLSTINLTKREAEHTFQITENGKVLVHNKDYEDEDEYQQCRALFVKGRGKTQSIVRNNTAYVRCMKEPCHTMHPQQVYIQKDSTPVCLGRNQVTYRIKLSQTAVEAVRKAKKQGYIQGKEGFMGHVCNTEQLIYQYYVLGLWKHKSTQDIGDWCTYFQIQGKDTVKYWAARLFLTEVVGPAQELKLASDRRKRKLDQRWIRQVKKRVKTIMTDERLTNLPVHIQLEIENKLNHLDRLTNVPTL